MQPTLEQLSAQYARPGLRFATGQGGLLKVVVNTPDSRGELYLQGAHVTRFEPTGQAPVLWLSEHSLFSPGKPIRGGVPICFPWFGPHATDGQAPAHGVARLTSWDFVGAEVCEDRSLAVVLQTTIHGFELSYRVAFGAALEMSLTVELPKTANAPSQFEEALHTYLAVSDIRAASLEGLESADYLDKLEGSRVQPASNLPLRFTGECDRVYLDTTHACLLHDPGLSRTIRVEKSASGCSVVWNPWIDKSARMPDFGDAEWQGMLCIETANVGPCAIELKPGESHTMLARIAMVQ